MSFAGASDVENESSSEFRRGAKSGSRNSLVLPKHHAEGAKQLHGALVNQKNLHENMLWDEHLIKRNRDGKSDDSDSEISDSDNFLAKGAFLLTPSHELTMDRAASICEKMNFRGCFSLTKTATGILFKFSDPLDYQAVYKKGFLKVTGARFYRKVAIPCRPQKTFTVYVLDVPLELPEEDIRHSLYKFTSVVEVVRLVPAGGLPGTSTPKPGTVKKPLTQQALEKAAQKEFEKEDGDGAPPPRDVAPPPIRVTLASHEEYNILLQHGLDFYGATFFPTENIAPPAMRIATKKGGRMVDGSIPGRVRELLPVFDSAGFSKIPPPASKTIKPRL